MLLCSSVLACTCPQRITPQPSSILGGSVSGNIRKSPPMKLKWALPHPPPKRSKYPPPPPKKWRSEEFYGHGGFPAETTNKSQAPTKLVQPFLVLELRAKISDISFFSSDKNLGPLLLPSVATKAHVRQPASQRAPPFAHCCSWSQTALERNSFYGFQTIDTWHTSHARLTSTIGSDQRLLQV